MDPSANQQQPTSQAPPQNAYPPQQQPQSGQPQVVQQTQHGDQQPLDDLLAHVSQRLQATDSLLQQTKSMGVPNQHMFQPGQQMPMQGIPQMSMQGMPQMSAQNQQNQMAVPQTGAGFSMLGGAGSNPAFMQEISKFLANANSNVNMSAFGQFATQQQDMASMGQQHTPQPPPMMFTDMSGAKQPTMMSGPPGISQLASFIGNMQKPSGQNPAGGMPGMFGSGVSGDPALLALFAGMSRAGGMGALGALGNIPGFGMQQMPQQQMSQQVDPSAIDPSQFTGPPRKVQRLPDMVDVSQTPQPRPSPGGSSSTSGTPLMQESSPESFNDNDPTWHDIPDLPGAPSSLGLREDTSEMQDAFNVAMSAQSQQPMYMTPQTQIPTPTQSFMGGPLMQQALSLGYMPATPQQLPQSAVQSPQIQELQGHRGTKPDDQPGPMTEEQLLQISREINVDNWQGNACLLMRTTKVIRMKPFKVHLIVRPEYRNKYSLDPERLFQHCSEKLRICKEGTTEGASASPSVSTMDMVPTATPRSDVAVQSHVQMQLPLNFTSPEKPIYLDLKVIVRVSSSTLSTQQAAEFAAHWLGYLNQLPGFADFTYKLLPVEAANAGTALATKYLANEKPVTNLWNTDLQACGAIVCLCVCSCW